MQEATRNIVEDDIPSDVEILRKTLDSRLNQELVVTKIKDEHGRFLNYLYFDSDMFAGQIEVFKSQRRIVDEYTDDIYNTFLQIAKLKDQKEQENNILWINQKGACIRPDIFNASLSQVVVDMINKKIAELGAEDNPLFNLEYVNYTQRLNQNLTCIENIELARDGSLIKKHARPMDVWEKAMKYNTSVDKLEQQKTL